MLKELDLHRLKSYRPEKLDSIKAHAIDNFIKEYLREHLESNHIVHEFHGVKYGIRYTLLSSHMMELLDGERMINFNGMMCDEFLNALFPNSVELRKVYAERFLIKIQSDFDFTLRRLITYYDLIKEDIDIDWTRQLGFKMKRGHYFYPMQKLEMLNKNIDMLNVEELCFELMVFIRQCAPALLNKLERGTDKGSALKF